MLNNFYSRHGSRLNSGLYELIAAAVHAFEMRSGVNVIIKQAIKRNSQKVKQQIETETKNQKMEHRWLISLCISDKH